MSNTLFESLADICNSVWGTDVSYTSSGQSPVSIKGVFDNAYVDVEGVVSLKPILLVKLADLLADPGKGDEVTIDETDYKVMESRLDGNGGSSLILQRA